MIEISFLTGELAFLAIWVIVRVITWIIRRGVDWKREALLLLMYVNLAVIIRFTFYPIEMADGHVQPLLFDPSAIIPFKLNLIPFTNLFNFESTKKAIINIVGNCAMFIPSGIVLPALYPKLRGFWKTVLAGAGISLCIELIQLLFYTRTTDTNDLILNTLGVMAGYGIYAAVRAVRQRSRCSGKHSG